MQEQQLYLSLQKLLPAASILEAILELKSPRNCRVCKAVFTKLHYFYDIMCSECNDLKPAKRQIMMEKEQAERSMQSSLKDDSNCCKQCIINKKNLPRPTQENLNF
jgi:hypothetical protein